MILKQISPVSFAGIAVAVSLPPCLMRGRNGPRGRKQSQIFSQGQRDQLHGARTKRFTDSIHRFAEAVPTFCPFMALQACGHPLQMYQHGL